MKAATKKAVPQIRQKSGRFVKGQSGNPGGRPKGATSLGETIRAFLAEKDGLRDRTRLESLIQRLYDEDAKTLLAYGFGKPIETHDVSVSTVAGLPEEVLQQLQTIAQAAAAK